MKKWISLLLCVCLLLSAVPTALAAAGREQKVWYTVDFDDGTLGAASKRDSGGWDVSFEYPEDGKGGKAVHIQKGKNQDVPSPDLWYSGLKIDVQDMLIGSDVQNADEGYSVGFRAKAEPGVTLYLSVEMFGLTPQTEKESGHFTEDGKKKLFAVTGDAWTTVSLNDYFFVGDLYGNRNWANSATTGSITFITYSDSEGAHGTLDGLYLDDIQISGPVDAQGGETPSGVTPYTQTFDDLPLGRYGESTTEYIKNDADGQSPAGGNYLHVSSVNTERGEATFFRYNVNAAITAQGAGNYNLSFWARADLPMPLLFLKISGGAENYPYLNASITDSWAHYTVPCVITETEVTQTVTFNFLTGDVGASSNVYFDNLSFDLAAAPVDPDDPGPGGEGGDDPDTPTDPQPFVPAYPMDNAANLIAPYGDFESFQDGDLIWSQAAGSTLYQLSADAHAGSHALLVSGRTTPYDTVALDVTDILRAKGSGKYYLSFYAKATAATSIIPTLRLHKQGGEIVDYYLPERYLIALTDGWAQYGVKPNETGYYFAVADRQTGVNREVDVTDMTSAELVFYGNLEDPQGDAFADYLLDDVVFWSYYDGQAGGQPTVSPEIRVVPKYTYENPLNLLDPYGGAEGLAAGSILWNGTVTASATEAHSGTNYLQITGRDPARSPFDFCVFLSDVINDNGAGKYYWSCWLKTAEPGATTTLLPYLYYHETETVYEMPAITVTDQWQRFGMTYNQVEQYINAAGGGLPTTNNVVEFRFYNDRGADAFPDYLVDDMAFWKYTDAQLGVEPDSGLPAGGETAAVAIAWLAGVVSLSALVYSRKRKESR